MVKKRAKKEDLGTLNKEFEIFSRGIERLEEIRSELDSLDARGFEREVSAIRSGLKNVSAIPLLERQLKSLKNKISRKYLPHKHRASSKLKTKIMHLEEEVEDIPDLERKINALRRKLKEKKSISVKKQLSKKQLDFVKDIPSLEAEIKSLRETLKRHIARVVRPGLPVDDSVAALVESKFGDFLYGIEKELSERMKKREDSMDKRLKYDLELRASVFKNKYKSLVGEFSQVYENKVRTELRKDVAGRFNRELRKKIKALKTKVREDYIPGLKREAHAELNKRRNELKKKAADRLRSMKHSLIESYAKRKDKLVKDYAHKRESMISQYSRKIEMEVETSKHEKASLSKGYSERSRDLSRNYSEKNKVLAMQYAEKDRIIKQKEEHLQKLYEEHMRKLKEYKDELNKKLREEAHKKMIAEIHQEEERLRRDLRDRFNEKLRMEMQRRQQEFDKKKLELELAIRKQAKAMLR